MDKNNRLRLGILFNIDKNWLGGVYYIINTIKSLDYLSENEKPEVIVFYNHSLQKFLPEIELLPFVTLVPWEFESVSTGYFKSWINRKNIFINQIIEDFNLDGLYPVWHQPVNSRNRTNVSSKEVSWFADLQHKYYPGFFSRFQWLMREFRLRMILRNATDLVVSSKATANDFQQFYKIKPDLNLHVLNFVSIIDDFNLGDISAILKRYNLPEKYFIVSNQFHKHKNHIILLKSLAILKDQGNQVHLAITGKLPDDDHSPYIKELHEIIRKHDLSSQVSFLGIIPRKEQLCLMKHSQAIIQPSLFEGWSTVIEDGKSLQVPVIASNLNVNREQLGETGSYFDPHNEEELADILMTNTENKDISLYEKYEDRVQTFAKQFIGLFK